MPAAASVEALVADPRTQALLLLTPPNARHELLQLAIAHRKPVLMEKPVARTTAEAAQLVALADAARLPLGIVLQHRKRRGAQALARLLGEGRLGRIGMVRLSVPWWRDQAYYDAPGRGTIARDGGGVLLSQAIHALDLMLHLLGPVTQRDGDGGNDDAAPHGDRGRGHAPACSSPAARSARCSPPPRPTPAARKCCGSTASRARPNSATASWCCAGATGAIEREPDSLASGTGADPMAFDHGMHRGVIEDFVDAVAAGRDAPVPARSVMAVHHLIDAVLASSREGRRLDVAQG